MTARFGDENSLAVRQLEPEVMDTPEEAREYDEMDHSEVNRSFVAEFLAARPDVSAVLDLGTGTALIPLELLRQQPAARVVAVDLSQSMLDLAARNIAAAGLTDAITLRLLDAKSPGLPDAAFSAAMSNSIVHHLPDPLPMLRETVRLTAPGGVIFVRDLYRPDDEATLAGIVEQYAGDATPRQRQLFSDSLRAALTLAEIRECVATVGGNPTDVQMSSDRHWTWATRKPA